MKKIVVLGATGMLGHKACQLLAARGHHVVGCLRDTVESVRDRASVFEGVELVGEVDVLRAGLLERVVEAQAPDFVLNAVGLVKQLDEASDPYLAVAINSLLPHRLARACDSVGVRLIHVSTDCVFNGRRGGYRETELTDAEDLYGRSKALGETSSDEQAALTLRTSFIGRELRPPAHGLLEWFLGERGRSVRGFAEVVYSGLTSRELSRVVGLVVERDPGLSGVAHVAGDPITKYDLLELIRTEYDLDVEIERVEEPRLDRSLVMERFSKATGYRAPSWSEMVREMRRDPTPYDDVLTSSEAEERGSET